MRIRWTAPRTFALVAITLFPTAVPAWPQDAPVMILRNTEVTAQISGLIANVDVVQTYANPMTSPVEAIYSFPLPDMAAVRAMTIEIGERRIVGEIKRREEARQTYQSARAAGYAAALLDQERPNIFTQSIANILPGHDIRVWISYTEPIACERGECSFLFPTVVMPRYMPASGAGNEPRATGHLTDGEAPPIAISVTIDAGVPIRAIRSGSHRILTESDGGSRAKVTLAQDDSIPNKDFILRYAVAGEEPAVGLIAHRDPDQSGDGFFSLVLQPELGAADRDITPKEMIFVIDASGSMEGAPIEMVRKLMHEAIRKLASGDTFNIIRFANDATPLAAAMLDPDPRHLREADALIDSVAAGGGTEFLEGLKAALAQPRDPSRIRIVLFLTDGGIGNENEVLEAIQLVRGDARIFTLGAGSSPNHYLLSRMSVIGHGAYAFVRPEGEALPAMEAFYRRVSHPYLTDLSIDWGGLPVSDLSPSELPDLFGDQPLAIAGRYSWGATGTVTVRGTYAGAPWARSFEVALPDRDEGNSAVATLWARRRIEGILMSRPGFATESIRAEVTSLALTHHLMSPFTSFVAVDRSVIANPPEGGGTEPGEPPLPSPEFISLEAEFGPAGPVLQPAPPGFPEVSPGRSSMQAPAPGMGRVQVWITDETGSPFPGTIVTLADESHAGALLSTITNSEGQVTFPAVAPGSNWAVAAQSPGYARVVDSNRAVAAGATLKLRYKLSPERQERVMVTAMKPASGIDEQAGVSRISGEFFPDLPLTGHSYQAALTPAPGVQDSNGDGDPNVHGARDRDFKARVDGISNVDPLTGTFMANLSSDAIQEIEVVTGGQIPHTAAPSAASRRSLPHRVAKSAGMRPVRSIRNPRLRHRRTRPCRVFENSPWPPRIDG